MSPTESGPTPAGVPVATISPGSNVMILEIYASSCWDGEDHLRRRTTLPFYPIHAGKNHHFCHIIGRQEPSGPIAQNVSNPLARVH